MSFRRGLQQNRTRRNFVDGRPSSSLFVFTTLIAVCCTFAFGVKAGQQVESKPAITPHVPSRADRSGTANLRLDVKVILVPVTVTDAMDRPLTALSPESFRVLEDGIEQKITSFSQEDGPVSLGLLFDTSGSMKNRIETSLEALKNLFRGTVPGDEFLLVRFSDQAELLSGFTTSPDEIYAKLGRVQPQGWTAMLDAIALGSHHMKSARNPRKVLLILSDGGDNNSRFSEPEIRTMVLESDVRVYAIGVFHRSRFLQQLADETGGRLMVAENLKDLPDVVERLSREIRSHYLLGYVSNNPHNDGKYRKVKVEVAQPFSTSPLRTSWRRGYYAPNE
jgi:Ca-activated chloride channel homolog